MARPDHHCPPGQRRAFRERAPGPAVDAAALTPPRFRRRTPRRPTAGPDLQRRRRAKKASDMRWTCRAMRPRQRSTCPLPRWSLLRCPRPWRMASRCAGGLLAGGGIPRVVYGRSRTLSTRRSAHGRCPLRVSCAAPPSAACRPGPTPPLRASPPRNDAAPQGHLREPRKLARVTRPGRAARAGIR
jgi:hypothetical protein